MDRNIIRHPARRVDVMLTRSLEVGRDCLDCPDGEPETAAHCPDCDAVMMYRGLGRLRDGRLVHSFECVHSHREVHSLSIVITQ